MQWSHETIFAIVIFKTCRQLLGASLPDPSNVREGGKNNVLKEVNDDQNCEFREAAYSTLKVTEASTANVGGNCRTREQQGAGR